MNFIKSYCESINGNCYDVEIAINLNHILYIYELANKTIMVILINGDQLNLHLNYKTILTTINSTK